jgi:hypothetical protein
MSKQVLAVIAIGTLAANEIMLYSSITAPRTRRSPKVLLSACHVSASVRTIIMLVLAGISSTYV